MALEASYVNHLKQNKLWKSRWTTEAGEQVDSVKTNIHAIEEGPLKGRQ